ncbi:O-antigen ligase family protein [Desulfosporosinus sp. OT]|uniref:O-antigen ligase family protein n=1 Tax=Desulfosporosinus sp. OT TaxID=913865 RepID=UPI001A996E1C|nr:O-antigen ligase family protein [Desulfosporosinus sp. OT]
MVIIIILCALLYVSLLKRDNDLLQIRQVIVATALGYGIVFFMAMQMNIQGINVGGLSTSFRMSEGIILKFVDITQGRLRGFFIDPNVVVTGFIVAIAISICSFPNEPKFSVRNQYLLTIIICATDLYYTESRAALMTLSLTVMLSLGAFFKNQQSRKKITLYLGIICLTVLILIILVTNINWNPVFFKSLIAQYENRSALNDEYGRITIWKNAWQVLMNNNSFLGIGQGRIPYYTYRDCHNTWLEWIVGNGIVVGSAIVATFISVPIIFYQKCQKIKILRNDYYSICLGLVCGFIGIFTSLFSVSNISNSYLIFITFLLISIRVPSFDKK